MNNYSTFRVIKIIDEYSLVINGGLKHDISTGDEIEIFLEGDEIIDPFSENEKLGTLDFIKEILCVTEVYSKFAVCKKIVKEKVFHQSALQKALVPTIKAMGGLTGLTEEKTTEIKIIVDPQEITGRKTGDKTIKIGDLARIALEDTDE